MGSLTANTDAPANNETDKHSLKSDVSRYEVAEDDRKPYKNIVSGETSLDEPQNDIFAEALARYPNDECIDAREENKVRRKLDLRILPVLGVCYFFYYVDKTTLFVFLVVLIRKSNSVLICSADHTPPSSAYGRTSRFKARSIHGCQAVSTLVGWPGLSHRIS